MQEARFVRPPVVVQAPELGERRASASSGADAVDDGARGRASRFDRRLSVLRSCPGSRRDVRRASPGKRCPRCADPLDLAVGDGAARSRPPAASPSRSTSREPGRRSHATAAAVTAAVVPVSSDDVEVVGRERPLTEARDPFDRGPAAPDPVDLEGGSADQAVRFEAQHENHGVPDAAWSSHQLRRNGLGSAWVSTRSSQDAGVVAEAVAEDGAHRRGVLPRPGRAVPPARLPTGSRAGDHCASSCERSAYSSWRLEELLPVTA